MMLAAKLLHPLGECLPDTGSKPFLNAIGGEYPREVYGHLGGEKGSYLDRLAARFFLHFNPPAASQSAGMAEASRESISAGGGVL
jgi:hypothetical protein